MGAALSIVVLLSISAFLVRLASVALRLTGLDENIARFQAVTAFTGTGYTTAESETIVNYPVRRRIIVLLMIIGNLGLVSVFATLVVSLVRTDGEIEAVLIQVGWLLAGVLFLWVIMFNKTADRIMCSVISKLLSSITVLGKRRYRRLVQLGNGHSVCEHPVISCMLKQSDTLDKTLLEKLELRVLAVHLANGIFSQDFSSISKLSNDDSLILFGRDSSHEELEIGTKKLDE